MATDAAADAAVDEVRADDGSPRGGESDGPVGAGRAFALLLVITGFAGLLAAWVITLDKFHLLEDPDFTPACSLNPVISCGSIMESDQAEAFGFPNPMLGMATYPVVIAIGMGLLAGARYRRWFWLGLQAGTTFGVVFCTWLQYQSFVNINALCLWCSLAWVATILMFWYTTLHNVRNGFLPAPRGLKNVLEEFHWLFPALHIGVIGMVVLTRWWDFWVS
ncbi:vitamin K epoxide reductase family protein [Streptomyces sp. DSM 44915]|uniref:Vitamin K epoxide reductase family protein n=1 Tax=Streptomyces chisholmiae TaxID=3075540 RepID=A0ABU2JW04_9ACTN|nr:vitamin K epoxide reductase family protein [Streptomyces sp. DSM 44915]MDT0268911.1 vitamin K epoxide reductase family protein [Streptomyces sp. DSM 44915]